MKRFPVGWSGKRIWIDDSWRVLDIGSGHAPFQRADVLLEKFVAKDEERSGQGMDAGDLRLVEGDALAMPFADGEFDYAVASHVAEHVDDPDQFCREVSRVAARGYVETPGWLGDIIMREPFHRWRVRKRRNMLIFSQVMHRRPLGRFGDALYALCYIGRARPGHPSITTSNPVLAAIFAGIRYGIAGLFRLPGIRGRIWMRHEWSGRLECKVWSGKEPVEDRDSPS